MSEVKHISEAMSEVLTDLAKTSTQVQVLKTPGELIEFEKSLPAVRSYDDLFDSKSKSFYLINKTLGEKVTVQLISVKLTELCKYLSFDPVPEMIVKAAELISQEYDDCKLKDMEMFERYVLTLGEKIYRVDVMVILELFKGYYSGSRAETFSAKREERARSGHPERNGEAMTTEQFKALAAMAKKKSIEKDEQKKEEQAVKFMTPEEICNRNGVDYDKLLSELKDGWFDDWKKSGVDDQWSFDSYFLYRKKILDLNIKSGKLTG